MSESHSWPNYPFKVRSLFKSSNNDANRANKAREVVIYLQDTNVQTGQCMRPPSPPHKDTSWSIPALTTVGQTATWRLLTFGLYSYRACRERRTPPERRDKTASRHTPRWVSHLPVLNADDTFRIQTKEPESRRCINDLVLQLPKPHIWLELERKTTKHPVSIKPPLKSDWELIEKSSSK